MFQHPLKAEAFQKRCSFYIQDDGKLQIGIVLQLCELISEERGALPTFPLRIFLLGEPRAKLLLLCSQKHL